MSEKFAFQKRLGKRRTVHRNQGVILAHAVVMNRFGHKLFACAAFPFHKHRGTGWGYLFNDVVQRLHGFAFADDVVKLVPGLDSIFKKRVLLDNFGHGQRFGNVGNESLVFKRF